MKLCVVAGEASGDIHPSEVSAELKKLDPSLVAFGIGGDHLREEGVEISHDARDLAIVGLFNVVRHLPMFKRVFREIVGKIRSEKPDAVLLVDYPDFNLRLARVCKEMKVPVIYFVSPQLWAWRKGRVKQIREHVAHMLVIFPFEETFYREHGVPSTYVGHPLVEQLNEFPAEPKTYPENRAWRIALMPGSRRNEVESLLAPMLDAIERLQESASVEAFIVKAPTISREMLQAGIDRSKARVSIVESDGRSALASADISLSSSGTATLEAAILGVPVIVMYRLSRLTYALAKRLVKLPHFSLVNIIAGKKIVPELLQDAVNGAGIAAEVRELMKRGRFEETTRELQEVRKRLGDAGASRRAAEKIYTLVTERNS